MNEVIRKAKKAKQIKLELVQKTSVEKDQALLSIAKKLLDNLDRLLEENEKDVLSAKEKGISDSVIDRLRLDEKRIRDMSDAVKLLTELKDPVGETIETIEKENGLLITKTRVPLGVVGMIYEARPNVTVDAATLCVKTGNAVILRGSSSASHSNRALVGSIQEALVEAGFPAEAVQLIEDTSKETAKSLFTLNEYLDVLIPRGGKGLIQTVIRESTVPVLETGAGNCHIYVDASANKQMAINIVRNAKVQRPSVCNSVETVLLHSDWALSHSIDLFETLEREGVEIRGDKRVCELFPSAKQADETGWETEFLAPIIRVKIVGELNEAISHIEAFGTKHSEAIITEDTAHAEHFQKSVDAAAVYHNASTRFTDGFEFGYGAEIGISTQKLHARGPMGLQALTSSKYIIQGTGQVRE
ncbi:glutamate-5-semialdehyde dehydrogenase [Bacillus gobiensis]|uniref:glutamate-5-semialdehyde dehydrogenase n=1 Tax=Bacillus gobiensis TaxID=1441095 RepID=UPI003D1CA51B